jgi:hypothetical protein
MASKLLSRGAVGKAAVTKRAERDAENVKRGAENVKRGT